MTPLLTHPAWSARRAFTLVELLTVIAIIGILAAILIPATSKVRANARAAQCSSNLRQIHVAITLYAGENRGRLPGGINDRPSTNLPGKEIFRRIVPQYLASNRTNTYEVAREKDFVLQCPSANFPGAHADEGSYGANYNMRVGAVGGVALINNLLHLQNPSQVLLAGDRVVINSEWLTETGSWALPEFRHGGALRAVFYDGSVKTLQPENLADNTLFLPR